MMGICTPKICPKEDESGYFMYGITLWLEEYNVPSRKAGIPTSMLCERARYACVILFWWVLPFKRTCLGRHRNMME